MTAILGYGLYLVPGLAQLTWAVRLWCLRLLFRYPFLVLYLLFSTLSSIIVLTAHIYSAHSNVYGWLFLVMQPVGWTLLLCVVLEIYQRMTHGYEGLRRLGGLVMYAAVGTLAVVLTLLLLLDKPDGTLGEWANFWLRQERSVYLGLCMLSVFLAGFGAYFRLRVGQNVVVLFVSFGVLFGGQTLVLAAAQEFDGLVRWRDIVLPLLHGSCLLGGALAFSSHGEEAPEQASLGPAAVAETELILARKLEGFNQTLLRVLRQ